MEFLPLFSPIGPTPIGWTSPTTLDLGTFGLNATGFNVYRGDPSGLPNLLNGNIDTCLRESIPGFSATDLTETPALGSFYWYLVQAVNGGGEEGNPGSGRLDAGPVLRVLNSSGSRP